MNNTEFDWSNKVILVTGGTGSFGKKFVEFLLKIKKVKKVIVFSRDELKQYDMQREFSKFNNIRFFVGDIRDRQRLDRAFYGVNLVIHAAALKQVPICEYNPFEAVRTNIEGTQNIVDAAIHAGVEKVVALSTDKAVNPNNLYGGTKLVAEKIVLNGNLYVGDRNTRLCCVRYGNVIGSRGSVVPLFLKQRKNGKLSITDYNMTRFWITLDQGVNLVSDAITSMQGGEIFIPKIPSMRLDKLASLVAPGCTHEILGIRTGEKLHEALISEDEARNTREFKDKYIIYSLAVSQPSNFGENLPDGFSYTSFNNKNWLTDAEMLKLLKGIYPDEQFLNINLHQQNNILEVL